MSKKFTIPISILIFVFLYSCIFILLPVRQSFSADKDFSHILDSKSNQPIDLTSPHIADQALVKLKNSPQVYLLPTKDRLSDFISLNQTNSSIEYIEPNYLYQSTLVPNDEFFNQQFYLSDINVNQAWNLTSGSPSVVIAIIDTGVDINHPDLKNNIWTNYREIPSNGIDDDHNGYIDDYHGWDFIDGSPDPSPKFNGKHSFIGINHGTIISGVAAASGNNSLGITGVSWRAKIMPLRVLDGSGQGNTYMVAKAIDYARENGADIINLSFVGSGKSTTLESAIKRAYQAGVLVIAAAGNEVNRGIDMTNHPQYPVCHDGPHNENWVIGVASIDKNNKLASFSNFGKCVDLVAPGVGVFSTLVKNSSYPKYNHEYGGYWSGTSVSAPQVAGVAALVKSLQPKLSLLELDDLLLANTNNIDKYNRLYQGKLGNGKLDAYKVLYAAGNIISQAEHHTDKLVVAPGAGGGPHIRVFADNHSLYSQFFAFDENKRFGANIATYDLNHNGLEEIIVSAAAGEEPWIKIFDIKGKLKTQFLSYAKKMRSGVHIAIGDTDNDGQVELATVSGQGSLPVVKIFSPTGKLIREFYAFNKFYKYGLSVAVGDVNADGFDDIVIGSGAGVPGIIKIFNYAGQLSSQFMPYDANFSRGLNVAVGKINGSSRSEIVVAPSTGGAPQVRIFDHNGYRLGQFFAFNSKFFGGVNLATGDLDGDGTDEIIAGAGPGGGPHVRIFNSNGQVVGQFFAYNRNFHGGVKVASGK